jgi:hypothetical protein
MYFDRHALRREALPSGRTPALQEGKSSLECFQEKIKVSDYKFLLQPSIFNMDLSSINFVLLLKKRTVNLDKFLVIFLTI